MSISKRFAKYLVRKLSPEQQREVIKERIGEIITEESETKLEEISENLGSISQEKVQAFFRTDEYAALLEASVEEVLDAYMQESYPVLILEQYEFRHYQTGNNLEGPIATVHGFGYSNDSLLQAEYRALDILAESARKQGGNIVKILSKRRRKHLMGEGTYLIKGQLYVNNDLPHLRKPTGNGKPTLSQ